MQKFSCKWAFKVAEVGVDSGVAEEDLVEVFEEVEVEVDAVEDVVDTIKVLLMKLLVSA